MSPYGVWLMDDTGINVLPLANAGSRIISGELVGVALPSPVLLLGSGLLGLGILRKWRR